MFARNTAQQRVLFIIDNCSILEFPVEVYIFGRQTWQQFFDVRAFPMRWKEKATKIEKKTMSWQINAKRRRIVYKFVLSKINVQYVIFQSGALYFMYCMAFLDHNSYTHTNAHQKCFLAIVLLFRCFLCFSLKCYFQLFESREKIWKHALYNWIG